MISKLLKITAVLLALSFIAIQFSRPEFNNPPVIPGQRLEDITDVPDEIAGILNRSCADCHSNETRYPWYSGIAPISWGMYDHIRLGREELNFSVWGTYSEKRRVRKLEEMCEEVTEGNMPFYQYLWLQPGSNLSSVQKSALCKWTETHIAEAKE